MILDTNAVSDFADANQRLLNCLQQSAADIHLPVIVLGEYRYGVKSSRLRAARESWLDELESSAIVLSVTSETSRVYANIRHELRMAGQPILFDFTLGPHPISSKGTTELGGAKRRSAFGLCLH